MQNQANRYTAWIDNRDLSRRLAVTTLSLLALVPTSGFATLDFLTAGRPLGNGATIKAESHARAPALHEPTISTYTLTLAPGGSAILHRTPSPGYVLVHVLSGAIEAHAWHARLRTYRTSETWAEPARANDITAVNPSTSQPARALVLVVDNGRD